ncbi:DsbA family protein [Marinifilum flexuosum]|uniref:DsbA family protein n=1 Tax=Marinifilum flexuosum TaxID=1117708 RepID=UPI002494484D|nr:DsbA family protein [Marinifilum flexuosum]
MAEKEKNPLLCNAETGICGTMKEFNEPVIKSASPSVKPIKIVYYTDPICSACWGIEPQLRRLNLEYGHAFDIEYRMGGLLPNWNLMGGNLSTPADVANHWDEMSMYYDMPIDGDLWLEDPLHSSYPPSIAFKAAQLQSEEKAIIFLRKIRELLFLHKKNITKWEYISQSASESGLNIEQLKTDYENKAKKSFQEDLLLAQKMGVRGFPAFTFTNQKGQTDIVYGFRPYSSFEKAITKLAPDVNKKTFKQNWESLFSIYPTLTTSEFAELSSKSKDVANQELEYLFHNNEIKMHQIRNGTLWFK